MSVRVSDRDVSKIEFLRVSRDIEIFFLMKQNEKPKKFRYFFSEYLIKLSANVYINAKIANSVYVSDKETKDLRFHSFQKSIYYLQALVGQIEVIYTVYRSSIFTNSELEYISGLIYKDIALIKGVIQSDKKRYKDII